MSSRPGYLSTTEFDAVQTFEEFPIERVHMTIRAALRMLLTTVVATLATAAVSYGQQLPFDRLSSERLDVFPPSNRVSGTPGAMRIEDMTCRHLPSSNLRRRIVDVAVQEWGFFGFTVVDQTQIVASGPPVRRQRRRMPWLDTRESARVADSIAGYWAITSDGSWILSRQNAVWQGPSGVASRWRDPWSAAFVSWVMCESGLGDQDQFRRAIAHHAYIDQAIQARDDMSMRAAFTAYDVGERALSPGDLVCSARRPAYRTIAERRPDMGNGIRSHCDIVVQIDHPNERILVIGGNVRGAVSLKLLPAVFGRGDSAQTVQSVGQGRRAVFAHLRLEAQSIESNALENSPTIEALDEHGDALSWLEQRLNGGSPAPCCGLQTISTGPSPFNPAL